MMTRTQLYARTGAAAIAAVLALSSTQIVAQEAAQPVTTEPVTTTPAPTPATTEPVATPDPLAPTTNATETSTTKTTTTRTTARARCAGGPGQACAGGDPDSDPQGDYAYHGARCAAPVAAAVPPAAPPAPAAKPAPVVDLSAQPAAPPPQPAAAEPAFQIDQNELMLGGGALALIALAAAAIAMRRRRRLRLEEEEAAQYDYVEPMSPTRSSISSRSRRRRPSPRSVLEQTPRHDPIFDQQPAIVAPPMSAFPQTTLPQAAGPRHAAATGDCTELESWTERAKCGPTPDNPSQSLKKRLKRAAFFEQRDREVAAGDGAPVDADAGLPEAMDEPIERT